MAFSLPELPYDTTALEPYLSAETFEYHYGKHHKAYVDTLNGMLEGPTRRTQSLEEIILSSEGKKFNKAAQIWNHNLYWDVDGARRRRRPDAAPPATPSTRRSARYDKFREEFKTSATGQFGSGWTWLTLDGGKLAISSTGNADLPMKHGQTAVLTCDVWEHAYYIDYRNKRPDYVDTFLDHLINWKLLDEALG